MSKALLIIIAFIILLQFCTWHFLARYLVSAWAITFSFFIPFHVITLSLREVERIVIISLMH